MYCPDCGKENSENQRYCRFCGAGLAGPPVGERDSDAERSEHSRETQLSRVGFVVNDETLRLKVLRFQKASRSPLSYAFLLVLLGIVIVVLGNRVFQDHGVADIGTVLALLGVGLMGLKGFLMITRTGPAEDREHSARPAEPTNRFPTSYLPEPNASVIEHTTRTLDPEEVESSQKPH